MPMLLIDDRTYAAWELEASSHGQSVEDWLISQMGEVDLKPVLNDDASWEERFLAFVRRHRPTGAPLDDSRESIYD